MSSWTIPSVLSSWITGLSTLIDRRLWDVFPLVFYGLLLTQERRRTCTSWFRAGGIAAEFRRGLSGHLSHGTPDRVDGNGDGVEYRELAGRRKGRADQAHAR